MARTLTLGVLSPLLGGSYFGRIIAGVHEAARRLAVRVLVIPTGVDLDDRTPPHLNYPLAAEAADGWIAVLNAVDAAHVARITATGRPLVSISHRHGDGRSVAVLPDNQGGALAATRHLIEHGHERIAFVGLLEQNDMRERCAGYRQALAEAGLEVDERLVIDAGDAMQLGGAGAVERLLAAGAPFTAIFAATDTNAFGALEALHGAGLRVPGDVALIGFDDVVEAAYSDPPLSSIHQSFDELGGVALATLVDLLEGLPAADPVRAPNRLVVRRSCGCPEAAAQETAHNPFDYALRRSLENAIDHNIMVSLELLRSEPQQTELLHWLRWTPVTRGLLALWDSQAAPRERLLVSSGYAAGDERLEAMAPAYAPAAFPPPELFASMLPGELVLLHPIRTAATDMGVLVLAGPLASLMFGSTTGVEITGQWATLLSAALERQALHRALHQRAVELESSQEQLREAIETLTASEGRYRDIFEQTQAALAETEVLYQVARSLIASETLPDVLQAVVDGAVGALAADQIALVTMDVAARQVLKFVKGGPGAGGMHEGSFDELWAGLSGWVLRELKPALSPKSAPDPRESPAARRLRRRNRSGSVIVVPLRYRAKLLGTMTAINRRDERDFSQRDVFLMAAMANQAAIAIENARLFEDAQRRAREAETLQQAGAVVAATLRQDEALARILEQLARVVPYDSASVQLLRDGSLEIIGGRGWQDVSSIIGIAFPIPGPNPNTAVIQRREPIILGDVTDGYEFPKVTGTPIRSWMGVPLIVQDQVIGMLSLDRLEAGAFSADHARLAAGFADHVAIAIANIRLYTAAEQELAERRRAEAELRQHQERLEEQVAARTAELQALAAQLSEKNRHLSHGLELAHDIQLGLLPDALPWDPAWFAVRAVSRPAAEVGGDFYSFVAFPEPHLGAAVVGDISGKGVAAALIMALVLSAIDTHLRAASAPAELLRGLNAQLAPRLKANRMNAALLALRIDAERRTLAVANGGMVAPLLVRGGKVEELAAYGLPLGSLPEISYAEIRVALEPGDLIVLVSDGVVEAFNDAANEFFGFERLEAALAALPADLAPSAVIDALLAEVAAFVAGSEQHDDITVIAIRPLLAG
ncbi:MAG TPA: SpoIIE family protein phosphatase [Herpetosiphonaceae bacterium]